MKDLYSSDAKARAQFSGGLTALRSGSSFKAKRNIVNERRASGSLFSTNHLRAPLFKHRTP